jgi:hemerythrin superfamily protein
MNKSKLRKAAESKTVEPSAAGIITLLLKDHRAMRELMAQVKSKRSTDAKIVSSFKKLEKLVLSHVKAEERALLEVLKSHPKFEDDAVEGIEEHEIHRVILAGIHQTQDHARKIVRMGIFCEILEQHLDEEEEDLFPDFKKYAALSTRKKIGGEFLKVRKASHRPGEKLGALKGLN